MTPPTISASCLILPPTVICIRVYRIPPSHTMSKSLPPSKEASVLYARPADKPLLSCLCSISAQRDSISSPVQRFTAAHTTFSMLQCAVWGLTALLSIRMPPKMKSRRRSAPTRVPYSANPSQTLPFQCLTLKSWHESPIKTAYLSSLTTPSRHRFSAIRYASGLISSYIPQQNTLTVTPPASAAS